MRTIAGFVIAVVLNAPAINTQSFPKSIDQASMHGLKNRWYSMQLQGLDEPSFYALAGKTTVQAYRFLWLRTFHHPIAVRVDIKHDGTGVLTTKMGGGAGGYSPGKLVQNSSRELDGLEVKEFLALIERVGFWAAPNPVSDQTGTDGSQWVIEGLKSGDYHVIDRWSPHQGPAHEIGMFLVFDLAKMNIAKGEIY